MKYANLGRTGVKVSSICLGAMTFGIRTDVDESYNIIETAIQGGINFIDTANVYGQDDLTSPFKSRGRSEEIVGQTLQKMEIRHKIILATKFCLPMYPSDPNGSGWSRKHVIDQCEESLKRLRTSYIDLYQVHRPSTGYLGQDGTPIDETLRALDDLIKIGKIRYIGTSEFSAWQIVESLWVSDKLNINRFVCEQPFYNLTDRFIERGRIPMAKQFNMGIIPFSPLAGGVLTGKYKKHMEHPKDSRLNYEKWAGLFEVSLTEKVYELIEYLEKLSVEKGCTTSQIAIAWLLKQNGVTSVIIGPRTLEQLEDNLGSISIKFTVKELQEIDEISPPNETIGSTRWHRGS